MQSKLLGGRFLQAQNAPARLYALVARHYCAIKEAELRGCAADAAKLADEATPLRDALWYCDMVTGPDGHAHRAASGSDYQLTGVMRCPKCGKAVLGTHRPGPARPGLPYPGMVVTSDGSTLVAAESFAGRLSAFDI